MLLNSATALGIDREFGKSKRARPASSDDNLENISNEKNPLKKVFKTKSEKEMDIYNLDDDDWFLKTNVT